MIARSIRFRSRLNVSIRRWGVLLGLLASVVCLDRGAARSTDLPLPRFVSLKNAPANVRAGPGTQYEVLWRYARSGMPLEIFQEYGNWRRVRDRGGDSGWIYGPILSGNRTAVVAAWVGDFATLHSRASSGSRVLARLQPGVLLNDLSCDGKWCEVALRDGALTGSVEQSDLWGVYPGEVFGEPKGWDRFLQSWLG